MSRRERIIVVAVAALLVGGTAYTLVTRLLLSPAGAWDERIADRTKELGDLKAETDRLRRHQPAPDTRSAAIAAAAREALAASSARTFGADVDRAGAIARKHLAGLAERSGLKDRNFSFNRDKPITRPKGAYTEIVWPVEIEGTLTEVTNFLFLVNAEPYLQRVEKVTITPDLGDGLVKLSLDYATLTVRAEAGETFPTTRPATDAAGGLSGVSLTSADRERYDSIASRDLFRPYVKRRPPPPPPTRRPPTRRPPSAPPTPRRPVPPTARYQVTGLAIWESETEIEVTDLKTSRTRTFKVGDDLEAGKVVGTIVLVDRRDLPMPDDPEMLSPCRVILKCGEDYWAVELGQALMNKRLLKPSELPDVLRGLVREPPATEAASVVSTDKRDRE